MVTSLTWSPASGGPRIIRVIVVIVVVRGVVTVFLNGAIAVGGGAAGRVGEDHVDKGRLVEVPLGAQLIRGKQQGGLRDESVKTEKSGCGVLGKRSTLWLWLVKQKKNRSRRDSRCHHHRRCHHRRCHHRRLLTHTPTWRIVRDPTRRLSTMVHTLR